jgi:hypothetical protein
MPEFQFLGHGGRDGGHKSRLPLYLGLGALAVGFLVFRGRGGTSPASSTGGSDAGAMEFARIRSQAGADMSRLVAANDLERYRLDLAQANTPAGLSGTFTGEQFAALPKGVRKAIREDISRGGEIVSAGPGGTFRLIPTGRGIQGDLQSVQRGHSGLFSSSSSGIGAPAPQVARPGIIDILISYFQAAVAAIQAGGAGG